MMSRVSGLSRLAIAALLPLVLAGCPKVEAAAAKDPMKCERDPKCQQHNNAGDCSLQCADDPACMQRCEEVRATSPGSKLGH